MFCKRVLVVGGDGLIGRALCKRLTGKGFRVFSTTRRPDRVSSQVFHLQLENFGEKFEFPEVDIVCLCAALSTNELCTRNPELASQVNVIAPRRLSEYFLVRGVKVIFISSSAVFQAGAEIATECSPLFPNSNYGFYKAAAEEALKDIHKKIGGDLTIIRPTKVLGKQSPLIKKWVDQVNRGTVIRATDTMLISPISLDFVLGAIERSFVATEMSTLHISGEEELSFYDFALKFADSMGFAACSVEIDSSNFLGKNKTIHAKLDMRKTTQLLRIYPQSLSDVLREIC